MFSYVYFALNRDFIANNLCVNFDKPELECYGKCYLQESIKKNKEQEKNVPNLAREKSASIVFPPTTVLHAENEMLNRKKEKVNDLIEGIYSFAYLKEIFRPPCFCA